MSMAVRHWDPVEGEIAVATPDTAGIRRGIELPATIRRLLPVAAILGMLWTLVAGVVSGDFPFVPVAVTTVLFAAFFLGAELENTDGRRTLRRAELARRKGWSYTGKLMERVRVFHTVLGADGADRQTRLVKSERARAVERLVPELTEVRLGAFLGAQFDGEFWGRSARDDQPFWVAVGAMEMEAGLAGDGSLRRDAHGGRGGFGIFYSLLGAYRIDRRTGVRVAVRPESLLNKGPLDRDLKTESARFNAAFHISAEAAGEAAEPAEQAALRALTPATQVVMLELLERYHNVGFVLDDDILYFMAQDKLVGGNARAERVDNLLVEIMADFEAAKLALGRYVE